MKKIDENKIDKILIKYSTTLSYDPDTETSYLGKKKLNKSNLKLWPGYDELKKKFNNLTEDEIIRLLIEASKPNQYIDKKKIDKLKRLDMNNMEDWEKDMVRDDNGYIDKFNKGNMMIFFMNFPAFEGKFKYNEFSSIATYNNDLIEPHIVTDLSIVSEKYIGNNSESWVQSITNSVCHKHPYHPIIRALDMLPPWDKVKRVETYLIDYIGAFDTRLNRNMTKKFFYALFERLFHPGCRFDHMLITYDAAKGTGKTSIIIILLEALMQLAGNSIEDSGIISLNDLGFDKDTVQCLNKAWVAYVDELAKFLREEPEDVKKFITLTTDNARLSYERLNKNFPRHCVLYGSTNNDGFIKEYSDTCERRFWIVDCNGTRHQDKDYWDKVLPMETKLQILSEAYTFWKENPNYSYNELDEEDTNSLIEVQNGHTTASKDNILGDKINVILDFEYSNPEGFNNYYEWANEAKTKFESYKSGIKDELSSQEIDFFGQKNDEKPQKKSKNPSKMIQKIPIIWVKQFIQEELGRMINDDNYINKLIDLRWQKNKNAYYNNFRGCFCRIQ